jgi:hypothetical protein
MSKPPPPMRPLALAIVVSLKDLRIVVPLAAVAVLALALAPTSLALLLSSPGVQRQPVAPPQEYTASTAPALASLASLLPGGLPLPDPRQRKPPCVEEMGEEEYTGVCWIRLDVRPPCPEGRAWERSGKCYARVLEVKPAPREPTSGERRPLGIAEP